MRRLAGLLGLGLGALAGTVQPVSAQYAMPYVPPERYQERRWLEGDKVTFCIWSVSPTREIDRRVGEEIGGILLLEVEFYEFTNELPQADERFWEQILIQLSETCDAVMGFALVTAIVPDWLTPTRSYYDGPFVLAVTNPAYGKLGDVPPGSRIGSLLYSTADLRLIEYGAVQPEAQRWKRLPFTDTARMLDLLRQGTIEGALVWAPSLGQLADTKGIRAVPLDPVAAPATPVGMVLLSHNLFLRGQLDLAITALIEDGVIDTILEEAGLVPVDAPVNSA